MNVADWLKTHSLEQYQKLFQDNRIDEVKILPSLTEEKLTTLGLPLGHRLKFLRGVEALDESNTATEQQTGYRIDGRQNIDKALGFIKDWVYGNYPDSDRNHWRRWHLPQASASSGCGSVGSSDFVSSLCRFSLN